jgi:hypothetical protein
MDKRRLIFWILFSWGFYWVPVGWLMGLQGGLVPATKGQTEATLLWHEVREPLSQGFMMLGLGYSLMRLVSPHRTVDGAGRGFGEGGIGQPSAAAVSPTSPNLAPSTASEMKSRPFLKS